MLTLVLACDTSLPYPCDPLDQPDGTDSEYHNHSLASSSSQEGILYYLTADGRDRVSERLKCLSVSVWTH